jgi:hypothetical protein
MLTEKAFRTFATINELMAGLNEADRLQVVVACAAAWWNERIANPTMAIGAGTPQRTNIRPNTRGRARNARTATTLPTGAIDVATLQKRLGHKSASSTYKLLKSRHVKGVRADGKLWITPADMALIQAAQPNGNVAHA